MTQSVSTAKLLRTRLIIIVSHFNLNYFVQKPSDPLKHIRLVAPCVLNWSLSRWCSKAWCFGTLQFLWAASWGWWHLCLLSYDSQRQKQREEAEPQANESQANLNRSLPISLIVKMAAKLHRIRFLNQSMLLCLFYDSLVFICTQLWSYYFTQRQYILQGNLTRKICWGSWPMQGPNSWNMTTSWKFSVTWRLPNSKIKLHLKYFWCCYNCLFLK